MNNFTAFENSEFKKSLTVLETLGSNTLYVSSDADIEGTLTTSAATATALSATTITANQILNEESRTTNLKVDNVSSRDNGKVTINDPLTTQNLDVTGNLTVDGSYPTVSIPTHIHTEHITMNKDYVTGHQKTELTYNKITLEK